MLRNKIGPVFNTRNGTFFKFFVLPFFFEKSSSFFRGERDFQKQKTTKKQLGPVFNTKKGKSWTSFYLYSIYIYIYIYLSLSLSLFLSLSSLSCLHLSPPRISLKIILHLFLHDPLDLEVCPSNPREISFIGGISWELLGRQKREGEERDGEES